MKNAVFMEVDLLAVSSAEETVFFIGKYFFNDSLDLVLGNCFNLSTLLIDALF